MKKEEMKSWREARKKGFGKFVLVNGLIAWGLPMFIGMAFINNPYSEGFASRAAIVHYITWPLAGILYGVAVWFISEHRYNKAVANEAAT